MCHLPKWLSSSYGPFLLYGLDVVQIVLRMHLRKAAAWSLVGLGRFGHCLFGDAVALHSLFIFSKSMRLPSVDAKSDTSVTLAHKRYSFANRLSFLVVHTGVAMHL